MFLQSIYDPSYALYDIPSLYHKVHMLDNTLIYAVIRNQLSKMHPCKWRRSKTQFPWHFEVYVTFKGYENIRLYMGPVAHFWKRCEWNRMGANTSIRKNRKYKNIRRCLKCGIKRYWLKAFREPSNVKKGTAELMTITVFLIQQIYVTQISTPQTRIGVFTTHVISRTLCQELMTCSFLG